MVNWNSNVDALLFKHILKLHEIKPKYDELEKAMRADGIEATAKAITHRVRKIRSTTNSENENPSLGPPNVNPHAPAGSPKSNKKRKAQGEPKEVIPDDDHFNSANTSQEADSELADEASPKKKQKRAAPKKAKAKKEIIKDEKKEVIKDEEYDDNDGPM